MSVTEEIAELQNPLLTAEIREMFQWPVRRSLNEGWFLSALHFAIEINSALFPVNMKIDVHTHILPKTWPDLKEVLVIYPLIYLSTCSSL